MQARKGTYCIVVPILHFLYAKTPQRLEESPWRIENSDDLLVRPADEAEWPKPGRIGHIVPVYLGSSDLCPGLVHG